MKFSILIACTCTLLMISCKSDGTKQDIHKETTSKDFSLSEFMVDNWETTEISIAMPTANGKDSTVVFNDDFSNPSAVRAQSTYFPDNHFAAWYVSDGEKVGYTEGSWSTKDDLLTVEYTYSNRKVNPTYKVEVIDEGFKATSIYDWDGDGAVDDTLVMKTKRIDL